MKIWTIDLNQIRCLSVATMISMTILFSGCEPEEQTTQSEFFQVPGSPADPPKTSPPKGTDNSIDPKLKVEQRVDPQLQKPNEPQAECLFEIRVSPTNSLVSINELKIVADSDLVFRAASSLPLTNVIISCEGFQSHTEVIDTEKTSLVKLHVELKRDHEFLLARANEQVARGNLVDALNSIGVATELQPNSFQAARLQAEILVRMGHPGLARERLKRSASWAKETELRKELVRISITQGLTHEKQKDWASAVAEFDRAISLDPDQQEQLQPHILSVLTQQANQLTDGSNFDDAISSLDNALTRAENYLPAVELRGPLLIKVGAFAKAETDLKKILQARPDSPEIRALLGQALAGQGKFEAAAAQFETNLNTESMRTEALFQLGFCAMRINKTDEAIGKLSQAIQQQPDFPRAKFMRGVALLSADKINAATSDFQASIELSDSPSADMHYYLGVALERQNRFAESLAAYTAAIGVDADHIPARLNRSILLTQSESYDKALEDTTLVLRLAATNPVAWNNHGVVLNAIGQTEKAIDSFSAAIEQAPDYAEAWFNRGQIQFRRRLFEKSIGDLNQAIEVVPNVVEYWLLRAQAKTRLANNAGAEIDAKMAVQLDPQNETATELLNALSLENSKQE